MAGQPQAHPNLAYPSFLKTAEELEREVLRRDLHPAEDLVRCLGVGGGCQTCRPELDAILDRVWSRRQGSPAG